MTEEHKFEDFDPLARYGEKRDTVRRLFLMRGEIENIMAEKSISHSELATVLKMDADRIAAAIEGDIHAAEFGDVAAILQAAKEA